MGRADHHIGREPIREFVVLVSLFLLTATAAFMLTFLFFSFDV